jgi:DNA ligase-4
MSFPFGSVCELLNKLDQNHTRFLNTDKVLDRDARTVIAWFNKHNGSIPRQGSAAVAFLSCLFPERRPDRVYDLREKRLEAIVQQAQCPL